MLAFLAAAGYQELPGDTRGAGPLPSRRGGAVVMAPEVTTLAAAVLAFLDTEAVYGPDHPRTRTAKDELRDAAWFLRIPQFPSLTG